VIGKDKKDIRSKRLRVFQEGISIGKDQENESLIREEGG